MAGTIFYRYLVNTYLIKSCELFCPIPPNLSGNVVYRATVYRFRDVWLPYTDRVRSIHYHQLRVLWALPDFIFSTTSASWIKSLIGTIGVHLSWLAWSDTGLVSVLPELQPMGCVQMTLRAGRVSTESETDHMSLESVPVPRRDDPLWYIAGLVKDNYIKINLFWYFLIMFLS